MKSKLKELIIHIAEKCKGDPAFGMTKLYKILFLADFNCYGIKGESISGAKYIHFPKGPVPYGVQKLIKSLAHQGRLKIEENIYFGHPQKRVVPITGSDTSKFNEIEIEIIDYVINKVRPLNATDLSNWTHELIPWLLTEEFEEIPYHTVFLLEDLPIDRASMAWAKNELEELRREGYGY